MPTVCPHPRRVTLQLQASGKAMRMGQRVQLIYTKTEEGVLAWDLPSALDPDLIDLPRYKELLFRAVYEVLQPLGVTESVLRDWIYSQAGYVAPPGLLSSPGDFDKLDLPLFAPMERLRV